MHFKLRKGPNKEVTIGNYYCLPKSPNELDLTVIPSNETRTDSADKYVNNGFPYFDPVRKTKIILTKSPTIYYYSRVSPFNTEFKLLPYNMSTQKRDSTSSKPNIKIYDPPADTTQYIMKMNVFNNILSDTIVYNTIHTKAKFRFAIDMAGIKEKNPSYSEKDSVNEAPLRVRFFNDSSKNGDHFKWLLVDSAYSSKYYNSAIYEKPDSIGFQDIVYSLPRTYYPRLISISKAGCVDTSAIRANPIYVRNSFLSDKEDVKNVFNKAFCPDENEKDKKYFYYRKSALDEKKLASIRNLYIKIFSQQGYLVYEYNDIVAGSEWTGWDGTVNGTSRKAPAGVYYYYFKATGFGHITLGKSKSETEIEGHGFVYLFRKE